MFTIEEARKLAKEVKDEKELLAKREQEVENYISNVLHHIELAIKYDKKHLVCNVGHFRRQVIDEISKRFEDLGFTVEYGLEDYSTGSMFTRSFQYITISGWIEKNNEKLFCVKISENEGHERLKDFNNWFNITLKNYKIS